MFSDFDSKKQYKRFIRKSPYAFSSKEFGERFGHAVRRGRRRRRSFRRFLPF